RMMEVLAPMKSFTIKMKKTGPMQFTTTFDKDFPELLFDEPVGSGGADKYPNASRILTAAVTNCLCASFTFCAMKSKIPVKEIEAQATCTTDRGDEGYWRIQKIEVKIIPTFGSDAPEKRKERCLDIFQNYCVVSASVKKGIDIKVDVDLG
ncbi:MAG: OsmC family protein, partial [Candidatus Hodarchaeota archaeon]